jgi:hypothetical protein
MRYYRPSKMILLTSAVALGLMILSAIISILVCREPSQFDVRPVGLGIQSYKQRTAAVTLTNLCRSKLFYRGKVERKTEEGWPTYDRSGSVAILAQGTLLPGAATNLTLPVMNYAQAYPWRISIFCYRAPSRTDEIRYSAVHWLVKLHLNALARYAWADPKVVKVSGPQMEQ